MIKIKNIEKSWEPEIFKEIVEETIKQFDIDFKKIEFYAGFTNAIFFLEDDKSNKYTLRICSPGWRTMNDIYSEAIWLRDLHEKSDIGAPCPVNNRDGDFLIKFKEGLFHPDVKCLLLSHLPGELMMDDLSNVNLYKMGKLFARLHMFSENYQPKESDFTKRQMNKIFAREEENELFLEEHEKFYPETGFDLFNDVWQKTEHAYQNLYSDPTGLMVIHHDLHHENILIDENGKLRPFDFEDTVWGYPVQDIAMAMKDLLDEVDPEKFEELFKSFKDGYESLRKWPEAYSGQMDDFMAGRTLWVGNWIIDNEPENFKSYVKKWEDTLRTYLETGKYRKIVKSEKLKVKND